MKKTLKIVFVTALFLVVNVSPVVAGSGSSTKTSASGTAYHGDSSNLKCTWEKYTGLTGSKMEATMKGFGNQKRVTAKIGAEGTVSSWVSKDAETASVTDTGPFGASSYYAKFEWK